MNTVNVNVSLGTRKVGYYSPLCSRCHYPKEPHRIGKQSYCIKCHAAYMRENRPKHSDLPEHARMKANARAYARVYLTRGLIQQKPCNKCGSKHSQMHHTDYTKPLLVTWLCRPCHLKEHQ